MYRVSVDGPGMRSTFVSKAPLALLILSLPKDDRPFEEGN
jgi:hypothetical protein